MSVGDVVPVTRKSHRRLLSLLALAEGQTVDTERLIDRFWPDQPPSGAKATLHTHVSALRRLLGANLIGTDGHGYRLDLTVAELDSVAFCDLADVARRAASDRDWKVAHETTGQALYLWRGTPFPDLTDDEFARADLVRLEETQLELWEMWAESLLRLDAPEQAVAELERLVVEHPYRERFWAQLMTARHRLGRHAEALRAFRDLSDHLAEIGLEPGPSLRRLEERILLHDEELRAPPHNLPRHLTSFIGREDETRDIIKMLDENRLVTLTGVGGSGKTRLAVNVASGLLEAFPEGCWFVGLADLDDLARIPIEIAGAVGIAPQDENPLEAVVGSIGNSEMLVVLDNCEHLLDGAADVTQRLLSACYGVKVLATSREPLHLPGERIYEVPPLEVPEPGQQAAEVSSFDAVRLFVDRATMVDHRFRSDETYPDIVDVCRRLNGIPLAIELAAAKARSFSVAAIDRQLEESLMGLAGSATGVPPRHRTLEAAVAWSYDLLDATEQRLLCRLSVFRGGFDIEMARLVASDPDGPAVTAKLGSLVEKSMVVRDRNEASRYRLLEPIRQFAEARLDEAGLHEETLRRHLVWCVDFAGSFQDEVYGPGMRGRLDRVATDVDNLHTALTVARRQNDARAVSLLASVLAWHWADVGVLSRSRDALSLAIDVESEDLRIADLRSRLGYTLWQLRDLDSGFQQAKKAAEQVRELGPSPEKAWVFSRLANMITLQVDQDPRPAIDLAREAVAVAEAAGAHVTAIRVRTLLAQALSWAGEVDEGFETYMAALEEATDLGDPATTIRTYAMSGDVVFLHSEKRRDLPRQLIGDMLARFPVDEWAGHMEFPWLAWVFIQSGEWDRAEDAIRRSRKPGLEGYERENLLVTWSTLRWMRGDLDAAEAALTDLEREGVNPRFYHDYYPLRTDLEADRGRLASARSLAETYLAVAVDPSEEARKLGVLNPLVRAEVNAALAAEGEAREEHVARAKSAIARMKKILTDFAPPFAGSVAMETHGTHLAFALAELSRVTGPDPDLWDEAAERADYAYFRLYARIRWAEAVAQHDGMETAAHILAGLAGEAGRLGAMGLKRLTDEITRHS